jgi:hypothetical protein
MKKFNLAVALAFLNVMAFAQDKADATVDLNINKSGDATGGIPWLWIIGGLVFVILLVVILSNRNGGGTTVVKD